VLIRVNSWFYFGDFIVNDYVNGIFEIVGGLLLVINIKNLCRDKTLKGVSVWPVVFFTAWGGWNLYYYPSLDQWASFWGGVVLVAVNTVWIIMVGWFWWKRKTVTSDQSSMTSKEKYTIVVPTGATLILPEGISIENMTVTGGTVCNGPALNPDRCTLNADLSCSEFAENIKKDLKNNNN
jgi:hypothetical protein